MATLVDFLISNRDEIITRTQIKVSDRLAPYATDIELRTGIPLFLDQLIGMLRSEAGQSARLGGEMDRSAAKHGHDRLAHGFTVGQVVQDYGSLCQALTDFAIEKDATISVEEFRTFNRCLDNAIAEAVTEFVRQRDQDISDKEVERLGFLAHELRNLLNGAMLAYQAVSNGTVAIGGTTSLLLGRSLRGMRDLIDRSLADVRLNSGTVTRKPLYLVELIEEVEVAATMDARERGLRLTVAPSPLDVVVEVDRALITSALSNLLQNAFKFTRAGGHVTLRSKVVGTRVLVEIEDECGGLPPGDPERLFQSFEQRGVDRSGAGLGLAISRRGVKANSGDILVRDLPGKGCVFTVSLPLFASRPPARA